MVKCQRYTVTTVADGKKTAVFMCYVEISLSLNVIIIMSMQHARPYK